MPAFAACNAHRAPYLEGHLAHADVLDDNHTHASMISMFPLRRNVVRGAAESYVDRASNSALVPSHVSSSAAEPSPRLVRAADALLPPVPPRVSERVPELITLVLIRISVCM